MEFRLEKEMTDIVIDWLSKQGLIVKKEFQLPWGVCDLVALSLYKNRANKRCKLGQKQNIGSYLRTLLLTCIPDEETGKSISFKRLNKIMLDSFADIDLERELALLSARKFVITPRKNHYQKLNGWIPLQRKIIAIELKLENVKEALFQSSNHKIFTPNTFVAFPIKKANEVVNSNYKDLFSNYGIGIIGVSKSTCQVILKPNNVRNKIDSAFQMYCVERFWPQYQRQ